MPVRVLIADDHPLYRSGTRMELEQIEGIEVVGEADDGDVALEQTLALEPDVLLLDVEMPSMSGVEVAEQLQKRGSKTRLLALSAHDEREYVYGLLEAGASGYLLKDEADAELLGEAIHGVARGEDNWISRSLAVQLLRRRSMPDLAGVQLTSREQEVVKLIALGLDNPTIAERLFISPHTVKNHLDKIKQQKIGVRTRAELIAWAWQHGVVKRGEQP